MFTTAAQRTLSQEIIRSFFRNELSLCPLCLGGEMIFC